ncbi:MAG: MaoC family dehydratase N-terminal domain-containing protein [Halovenus sp.]
MAKTGLEGTQLPSGEFAIEDWKAFLWADATRNEEDAFRYENEGETADTSGQFVPHSMCQHIVFEATGGIDETMSRLTEDWTSGAALGGLRIECHDSIETGEEFRVTGEITNVEQKEGSSGSLTIVTHAYEVTDTSDDPVYDLEADMVLLEGE